MSMTTGLPQRFWHQVYHGGSDTRSTMEVLTCLWYQVYHGGSDMFVMPGLQWRFWHQVYHGGSDIRSTTEVLTCLWCWVYHVGSDTRSTTEVLIVLWCRVYHRGSDMFVMPGLPWWRQACYGIFSNMKQWSVSGRNVIKCWVDDINAVSHSMNKRTIIMIMLLLLLHTITQTLYNANLLHCMI